MTDKPTLVLGASPNPDRFSNIAIRKLVTYHHTVYAVGLREGNVQGIQITKSFPDLKGIHTITLYVGPKNQSYYIDYILKIHPVRVIFNPGTENPEFEGQLRILGIEAVRGCTLIMLGNGTF